MLDLFEISISICYQTCVVKSICIVQQLNCYEYLVDCAVSLFINRKYNENG